MPRYRHWLNLPQGGETAFFTTKALDFAHVFARPEINDLLMASLVDDCDYYGASLHGHVVMANHIHLLLTPRCGQSASQFAQKMKTNSSRRLSGHLTDEERGLLAHQVGLNERVLWERGFKGLGVSSRAVFDQKLRYIHENPLRAQLCDTADGYRWSSAWLRVEGNIDEWECTSLVNLMQIYHPAKLPWPRKLRRADGSERAIQ